MSGLLPLKSGKILCSNVHYFYYDADCFFTHMQENGWREAELYLGTPHIFIDSNVIDDFAQIPLLAFKHNVRITDVHPETISFRYHLCSLDAAWNQSSLQTYRNVIRYASQIGAESVNTNLTGAFRDLDQEKIFARLRQNLQHLAVYAEEKRVFLTLEAESSHYEGFICNLAQIQRLDTEIDSPVLRFGVNVDALEDAGETLVDWEKAFGDRIRYLRFSSIESFRKMYPQLNGTAWLSRRIIFSFQDDCYLEQPYVFDRMLKEAVYGVD